MSTNNFNVGDRVRLSEIGRKRAKRPDRVGQIVGQLTRWQWRVLWQGLKNPQILHATNLERLAEDGSAQPVTDETA